ncbi:MAG TPA: AIR synthase-related protein, partial [Sphingomonas sp.]
YEGGKQAIAECYRNLCAVGATPLATTDCMNFGNPQRPEIMGQFVGCIEGMAEACKALDFPIVSGNVSLYNETKGDDGGALSILPTPAIGGVGLLEDWSKSATIAFKVAGEAILLLGSHKGHLGQSLWLRELHGREDGPPPPVDLAAEKAVGEFVRALIGDRLASAVHDVSDGGVAVTVAEMALAGGIGAHIGFEGHPGAAAEFFGEDQGLFVITTNDVEAVLTRARLIGVDAERIGETGGSDVMLSNGGGGTVPLADLRRAHEGFFPALMGADAALA